MASDSEDRSDLSSNYSGSDYSSDEGEQTFEQPVSDSATPSQPATSNRTPASAPIVPRLGVPSLVLGSRSADRSGTATMMTARPGPGAGVGAHTTPAEQTKQPPAVVHLVSFAFTLETAPSSDADLHAVRRRCVQAFGVAPEELEFFDLRTMGGNGTPAIGVAINNSSVCMCATPWPRVFVFCMCCFPSTRFCYYTGFSLEAMEQLLANNQQLSSAAERSTCCCCLPDTSCLRHRCVTQALPLWSRCSTWFVSSTQRSARRRCWQQKRTQRRGGCRSVCAIWKRKSGP